MKLYTILTIIWLLVREHQLDFCSILETQELLDFLWVYNISAVVRHLTVVVDNQEYSRISNDIMYSGPPFWETFGPGAIVDFKLFIGLKF